MYGSKWTNRIDQFGVWILLILVLLFVLTGYGATKQIMDPLWAKYLHSRLLPIPLFVFFLIHILKPVYQLFKSWNIFKNERTLNFYVYLLALIVLGVFVWLYFR